MDFHAFKARLTAEFHFEEGRFRGIGEKLFLAFVDARGNKHEIRVIRDIAVEDPNTHFAAMAILDANGNELVHITEPGKYFDHVFWNDHERGLFSIDCIDDLEADLDMDAYAQMSKDERIEQMPFFENLLATSLAELLHGVRDFTREEFWAR